MSQTSLGSSMLQSGASPDDLTEALIKNSQGQIPEGQDAVKGLMTAWAEFFGVPVSIRQSSAGAPQPATELVKKWALLMSTAATMGTGTAAGVGGMVTGGTIGGAANISSQMTMNGDKPFSYTDAFVAIGTGALSEGKGAIITGGISIGCCHEFTPCPE